MAGELAWTFDFTRERVPGLQVQLEWALQHQNRRFTRAFVDGTWNVRRVLVTALSGLGALLVGVAYFLDPAGWRANAMLMLALLALFVLLPIAVRLRRPRDDKPRSHRRTGNALARTAERIFKKPRAQAPYTIAYTCDSTRVHARVESLAIDRSFELRAPRLVIATPDIVLAFRRRWSFTPFRFVYVTAEARAFVLAEFTRAGVPVVELAGPVEGYVAPLPDARAR